MSKVSSHIQAISDMGSVIRTYVSGKLYFSGLHDTPSGYQGHSGDYLVVNDNESGIHFTGIEKIAADLTDYGFGGGGGSTNFTGLQDTPTGYNNDHYLRSSTTGIEYIDPTSLAVDAFTNITGVADSFVKIDTDGTGVVFGQPVEYVDSLPTNIPNGKLVSYNCDLYMGCDGVWESVRLGPGSDDPLPTGDGTGNNTPAQPVPIDSLDDCTASSTTIPIHSTYASYSSYRPLSFASKDKKTLINLSMYVENFYQNYITHLIKNESTGEFEAQTMLPWNKQIRDLSLNEKGNILAFVGPIDGNLSINYLHAYKYISNSNEWQRVMPPIFLSGAQKYTYIYLNNAGTEITLLGGTSFQTYSWNGSTFVLSRTDDFPSGVSKDNVYSYQNHRSFSDDGYTCVFLKHTSYSIVEIFKKINNTWTHIQTINDAWAFSISLNGKFLQTAHHNNNSTYYYDNNSRYDVWEYSNGQYVKIPEKTIYPRQLLGGIDGTQYGHEYGGRAPYASNDGNVMWFITSSRYSSYPNRFYQNRIHAVFWLESEQRWQVKTFIYDSSSGNTCKACMFANSSILLDGNASQLTYSNLHWTIDPNCVFTYFGESTTLETDNTSSVAFTQLLDTPADFIGSAGKALTVSSDESALEFTDVGGAGAMQLHELQDTPTGYQGHSGDYLVVNDNESGIHFTGIEKIAADLTDYGFGGGATNFTGLSDTPTGYNNAHYLRSSTTGIEYVDPTSLAVNAFNNITGVADSFVKIDTDGTGVVFGQPVEYIDSLPTNIPNGKLVSYNCDLYMGCDGAWESVRLGPGSDDPLPTGNDSRPGVNPDPVDDPDDCIAEVTGFTSLDSSLDSYSATYGLTTTASADKQTFFSYGANVDRSSTSSHDNIITHHKYDQSTQNYLREGQIPFSNAINYFSTNADGTIVAFLGPVDSGYSNKYNHYIHIYKYLSNTNEWKLTQAPVQAYNAIAIKLNSLGNEFTLIDDSAFKTYKWSGSSWSLTKTETITQFNTLTISAISDGIAMKYTIQFSTDGNTCIITNLLTDQPGTTEGELRHTITSLAVGVFNIFKKINGSWTLIQQINEANQGYHLSENGKFFIKCGFNTYTSNVNYDLQRSDCFIDVYEYSSGQYNKIRTFDVPNEKNLSMLAGNWGSLKFQAKVSNDGRQIIFITDIYYPQNQFNKTYLRVNIAFWLENLNTWYEKQYGPTDEKITSGWAAQNDYAMFMNGELLHPEASKFNAGNDIFEINPNCVYDSYGEDLVSLEFDTESSTTLPPIAFTDLKDVPDNLVGSAGKVVAVSSDELGLEFADVGGVGEMQLHELQDTPTGYQGHSGDYLVVNDNESGIHFTGIEKIAADLTDYGFGVEDTQTLTEQISQNIVNDNLIIPSTDYSFQTKYLNGSISNNGSITGLEFTNLTIGDTYRLSSTVAIESNGTATNKIKVNYYHDGNKIAAVYSDNISQSVSTSVLFNATHASLLVAAENVDASNYIEGSPNGITFTQVEKISSNIIAPDIIAITNGSTQTFDGATMSEHNYIKIDGENVSATIEIDGDSFVVAQSGDQMVWDQGGAGETTLNLGESHLVTLSNGRVIEIKFYRTGSLYFAINKRSEPSAPACVVSPVTLTVESEYDSETSTSTFKYTTSDSNGNGGLFGCIDAYRGEELTIFVTGDEPNLLSHPLKITNFNDLGQAMAPLSGVVKTDLTEGPTEDHTYSLTWVVPCDETINKYQYQCENHAHMKGTINVLGSCPSPTPTVTATPTVTPTVTPTATPTVTPTPSTSSNNNQAYSTFPDTLPFKLR